MRNGSHSSTNSPNLTATVISSLLGGNPSYRVGYDGDGSVFSAFSARYVPYSVIYDKRGRILWVGNPSSLSAADVADIIH